MFELPKLPFGYDDLSPIMTREVLEIHHGKHHKAYTDKLNVALEGSDLQGKDIEEILTSINHPDWQKSAIKNNAGGFYNHSFFWKCLCSQDNSNYDSSLSVIQEITKQFGSFEAFQEEFSRVGATHFGSGWVWLVVDNDQLKVIDTHDQVSPITLGLTPLLTFDLWEHAYYVLYQNRRPDYIKDLWKVVNWDYVQQLWENRK